MATAKQDFEHFVRRLYEPDSAMPADVRRMAMHFAGLMPRKPSWGSNTPQARPMKCFSSSLAPGQYLADSMPSMPFWNACRQASSV
jgi:hypothetical protein